MEWWQVLAMILGSSGLGALAVKYMDRRGDRAAAQNTEVSTIRAVLDTYRVERKEDRAALEDLRVRVGVLERRERQQLTLIAVHEAWDQLAHAALLAVNPQHPPPPPLLPPNEAPIGGPTA